MQQLFKENPVLNGIICNSGTLRQVKNRALAQTWWNDYKFHLKFAVRTPEDLNEMLDYSIDGETMDNLIQARKVGIPVFVNSYYLSLLDTTASDVSMGSDLAIRQYMFYSKKLVNEFGDINAWEKEDIVEPGKPNAAGWIIPDDCIHRRYPNVAILIPKSVYQMAKRKQRANMNRKEGEKYAQILIFEYPEYGYGVTNKITNLDLPLISRLTTSTINFFICILNLRPVLYYSLSTLFFPSVNLIGKKIEAQRAWYLIKVNILTLRLITLYKQFPFSF